MDKQNTALRKAKERKHFEKSNSITGIYLAACLGIIECFYSFASSASQVDIQPDKEKDNGIENITILGSRAQSRTASESPVPVDFISSRTLSLSGFNQLGQSLQNSAPSFNFSRTQVSDGSDLFRPATLRGLQPDQVLVLVNGKRRHNQAVLSLSGTVGGGSAGTDLNAIPMIALDQVQILRDGAAAQYGSDAIAGVINLVLKKTTNTTLSYIKYGETHEGDGETLSVGLNTGFDIGNEGGFFNLSIEYRDQDSTNRAQRDIGGSSCVEPGKLSDTVRWGQGSSAGDFKTIFFNSMLPINSAEIYSFGGYSKRTATGNGFYRDFNNAERNVPQVYRDGFLPYIDNAAEDYALTIGVKQYYIDDSSLDISASFGQNQYDFHSKNTINASYAAEYFYYNPNSNAQDIANNAGPTKGYSGGFEFDQFTVNVDANYPIDIGLLNPLELSLGSEYREEKYTIKPGELASYSCGYANNTHSYPSVIDPSQYADCGFQAYPGLLPSAATNSNRHSVALYLDLENQLTEKLLITMASRYEDFSQIGDDIIGKFSFRYQANDEFAVRGSLSTGFRAPSLQQTAYTAYTTAIGDDGELTRSYTAASGAPFPSALGTSSLKLESSENFGLGLVYTPNNDFSVTLDAYKINIDDRLSLSSMLTSKDVAFSDLAQQALQQTNAQQANYFSNAIDTSTKGLDLISTYQAQLGDGTLNVTLSGNLNETTIEAILHNQEIPQSIALSNIRRSFLTHGQPKKRATLTFNFTKENWSALLRTNYFGDTEVEQFGSNHINLPGFLSPTGNFLATSNVESAYIVDTNLQYTISEGIRFSFSVNNIFNETPEQLGNNEVLAFISKQAFKYPIRALPYGFDGRTYNAGLTYRF